MLPPENQLKVTLAGFDGTDALLQAEDDRLFKWPIKKLPSDVQEGAQFRLIVSTDKSDAEAHERQAREIINMLLRE